MAAIVIVALFYVYKTTIGRRFFASLTQKRKLLYLNLLPLLITGTGITAIVFDYKQNMSRVINSNKFFLYQGQIIDDKEVPIPQAYAYVIFGTDTIKSEPIGNDGTFTLKLDTVEGIKTTVYYGHSDYSSNSVFRALNSSTFERLTLKGGKSRNMKKRPGTFSLNIEDKEITTALEQRTGVKYFPVKPTYNITFLYDKSAIDSFDNRFRYLGGKVKVYIDGKLCCESNQSLRSTHAAGTNRSALEKELMGMIREIVVDERDTFLTRIAGCLGR